MEAHITEIKRRFKAAKMARKRELEPVTLGDDEEKEQAHEDQEVTMMGMNEQLSALLDGKVENNGDAGVDEQSPPAIEAPTVAFAPLCNDLPAISTTLYYDDDDFSHDIMPLYDMDFPCPYDENVIYEV